MASEDLDMWVVCLWGRMHAPAHRHTSTIITTSTALPPVSPRSPRSADGGVEGRPRAGRRQLLRGQALRAGQPDHP